MPVRGKFRKATIEAGQKFSIDDFVGIAEVIISVIKECQERRNATPETIKAQIADGGILARISLRRAFRDRGFSVRESRQLTDEAIDLAQQDESLITEALEMAQEVI